MTFTDLLTQIAALHILPNTAILELPGVLEDRTKKRLCRLTPARAAEVLKNAIDAIDAGSIERVDTLVNKQLDESSFLGRLLHGIF